MFKLIIQDDEGKTTIVPLIRDEISIGRKEGNTIRLTERNVSRRHARILRHNGTVVVEDLDSYNGVRVNGNRIQGRVSVNEADRIQIGDYLLELKTDRPAGAGGAGGGHNETLQGVGVIGGVSGAPERASSEAMTQPIASAAPVIAMPDAPTVPYDGVRMAAAAGGRALRAVAEASPQAATMQAPAEAEPDATPAPVPGLGDEPSGKLVVLSTSFAGREYVLDRAAMLIGRTDDNDVVINHRSISRHHAQLTFEAGRWSIVDKTSTNGVRVNGEDYGKVELRRGDVIELGHVKLRYVEVGEDYVFDGEPGAGEESDDRALKKRGWLIGLGTLAGIGCVAGLLFAISQGSGNGSTPATVAGAGPAAVQPEVAAAKPNLPENPPAAVNPPPASQAANPPGAPPSPQTPTVAKLLGDANDAVGRQQWAAAMTAAEQALKIEPGNADATRITNLATSEIASQKRYDNFVAARDGGRIAEAVKTFNDIPTTSVYSAKAARDVDEMHTNWLRDKEAEAKALVAKKQCDKLPGLVRSSAAVFPDAKAVVEKAGAGCQATTAVKEPDDRGELSDADLSTLLASAKEAAHQQDWTGARRTAEEILKVRPNDQEALRLAGMASCKGGDKAKAQRYIGRIRDAQIQSTLKGFCVSNGVNLDE